MLVSVAVVCAATIMSACTAIHGLQGRQATTKSLPYTADGPVWAGADLRLDVPSHLQATNPTDPAKYTFGGNFIHNSTKMPVTLVSVTPLQMKGGIRVIDTRAHPQDPDWRTPPLGNHATYPTRRFLKAPKVEGMTVEPYATSKTEVEIIIGLESPNPEGGFDGIEVRFRWAGHFYRVTLPISFHFCAGDEICPEK